jgi:hypothetical protein
VDPHAGPFDRIRRGQVGLVGLGRDRGRGAITMLGEQFLDRRGLRSAAVETVPALLDLDEARFECNYPRRHPRASAMGCAAEFAPGAPTRVTTASAAADRGYGFSASEPSTASTRSRKPGSASGR